MPSNITHNTKLQLRNADLQMVRIHTKQTQTVDNLNHYDTQHHLNVQHWTHTYQTYNASEYTPLLSMPKTRWLIAHQNTRAILCSIHSSSELILVHCVDCQYARTQRTVWIGDISVKLRMFA